MFLAAAVGQVQPFACRFQFDLPENSGNRDNLKEKEKIYEYTLNTVS